MNSATHEYQDLARTECWRIRESPVRVLKKYQRASAYQIETFLEGACFSTDTARFGIVENQMTIDASTMIASSHGTVGDGGVYKRRVWDSAIVEVDSGLVLRHARELRRVCRVRQLVHDLSADRKAEFFAQPLAQFISRRSKV